MTKWHPTVIEATTHQVSDTDYGFALERAAKILYSMFCRFETDNRSAPALMLSQHKDYP